LSDIQAVIGMAYHAGLGASLLRLEEDGFFMLATGAGLVGSRELQHTKEEQSQPAVCKRGQAGSKEDARHMSSDC
jgi:hypothetical protein